MRASLRDVCVAEPDAVRWGVAFEFELPLENGRRPDVVVLAGDTIVVVEFKQDFMTRPAAVDQVQAYARRPRGVPRGQPRLPSGASARPDEGVQSGLAIDSVLVIESTALAGVLLASKSSGALDLATWLGSPYAPLPALVSAARRIFQHEPLPAVRRGLSSGIPDAVDLLGRIAGTRVDSRRTHTRVHRRRAWIWQDARWAHIGVSSARPECRRRRFSRATDLSWRS